MALIFESKPCGRCGGSGKYSYCSMYGSTCFGCGGKGAKLTKRGAAAQAVFTASISKPAGDVEIGERILVEGVPGFMAAFWFEVREIAPDVHLSRSNGETEWTEHPAVKFGGVKRRTGRGPWDEGNVEPTGYGTGAASIVRVAQSAEERQAKIDAALAYQATLTASGTPRKRAVAA